MIHTELADQQLLLLAHQKFLETSKEMATKKKKKKEHWQKLKVD